MTKTKRPAEQLASEIELHITEGQVVMPEVLRRSISVATLRGWLRLARSIDARMRLDGSKLNKRKSAGRKRVTR